MKSEIYSETIQLPSGVNCSLIGRTLTFSKGSVQLKRVIDDLTVDVKVDGNQVVFTTGKPDKRARKVMKAYLAHIRNIFKGLDEKYTYKLEACNVHFPMTLKVDKNVLLINNFLGEKTPRKAVILPNVDVQVKGTQIIISGHDKEHAGQTAANIERATKVRNRDRRVFQDGIYIVEKAGSVL
ncbi:MAG TPA: 50S ribosomal protein L6 [Candidatus Nanoarchaeia archaeon]|nr:50S ribosomal protein L6 [Candidatus Nanoarchaeia archaeon]